MSTELNVSTMFTEHHTEIVRRVSGDVRGVDKRRMLTHAITDLADEILSNHGTNPVGLTITVSFVPGQAEGYAPDLLVVGTAPQYELNESFLRA